MRLDTGQVLVGRDPTCCALVLFDQQASRLHARISAAPGGLVTVEDMGSSNGTFINGRRINGPVLLNLTDSLEIGGSSLRLLDPERSALPMRRFLTEPFKGRGFLKLLIGSLLAIIPVASLWAEGYRCRIYRNGEAGLVELPEWETWGDLFTGGFLFFVIRSVYLLVPGILAYLVLAFMINIREMTAGITLALIAALALPHALFGFIIPMSLGRFAATGSLAEAFMVGALVKRITAVFRGYLKAILLVVALWAALLLLTLVPFLGPILAIIGSFYISCLAALLFGDLHGRSCKHLG